MLASFTCVRLACSSVEKSFLSWGGGAGLAFAALGLACVRSRGRVQETDRGRHDKKTMKERSLYSVDSDLELASCQSPPF